MNEPVHEEHLTDRFSKHRFIILIVSTILIGIGFVGVALGLYASSGAAQVDLSRPGYSSVRDKVQDNIDNDAAFPSDGPINKDVLNDFSKQYGATSKQITSTDSFNPKVLSDKSLRIDGVSQ